MAFAESLVPGEGAWGISQPEPPRQALFPARGGGDIQG
jgi:hypothetical protein